MLFARYGNLNVSHQFEKYTKTAVQDFHYKSNTKRPDLRLVLRCTMASSMQTAVGFSKIYMW
jgi:hypothetical protein